jgi:hypothetical protein
MATLILSITLLLCATVSAAERETVQDLPATHSSDGLFPSELAEGQVYRFLASYDADRQSWRLGPASDATHYLNQVPHPVAPTNAKVLGEPSQPDDVRLVVARVEQHAWVRTPYTPSRRFKSAAHPRRPRYRWTLGYVGEILSWEEVCLLQEVPEQSEAQLSLGEFKGPVAVGGHYTTTLERDRGRWKPVCMLEDTRAELLWNNPALLEAFAESDDLIEVGFVVETIEPNLSTSPFQLAPVVSATLTRASVTPITPPTAAPPGSR